LAAFYFAALPEERIDTTNNNVTEEEDGEEREEDEVVENEESISEDDVDITEDFISCLEEKGVVIYGSKFCPACTMMVESLGGHEMAEPVYVECTEEEARCDEEMEGGAVPEIQIEGEVFKVGAIAPEVLAKETNCEL